MNLEGLTDNSASDIATVDRRHDVARQMNRSRPSAVETDADGAEFHRQASMCCQQLTAMGHPCFRKVLRSRSCLPMSVGGPMYP